MFEHGILPDEKKLRVQSNTLDHFATPTIDRKSPTWWRFLRAYCYWIVEDMIPLNKLTKPGFKALLQVLGVKDAPQPETGESSFEKLSVFNQRHIA